MYTVVVNEVPVKDLLLALSRDTKQNIDIHPGLAGLVLVGTLRGEAPCSDAGAAAVRAGCRRTPRAVPTRVLTCSKHPSQEVR